jgi:AbrB family looped-hinge helix DNA binding protein
MATTLTLDQASRIVLPKHMRDELQIGPGDSLEAAIEGDQVVLRPARSKGRMYRKHGVWIFDSGEPLPADAVEKTIRKLRGERIRRNLGKLR